MHWYTVIISPKPGLWKTFANTYVYSGPVLYCNRNWTSNTLFLIQRLLFPLALDYSWLFLFKRKWRYSENVRLHLEQFTPVHTLTPEEIEKIFVWGCFKRLDTSCSCWMSDILVQYLKMESKIKHNLIWSHWGDDSIRMETLCTFRSQ